MGMPACTITSQTAHGGVVMVGFPTVLIGGLPASRIGDNHVCPMVTGVVPHVGGPFVMGSPTVLVGNMPRHMLRAPWTRPYVPNGHTVNFNYHNIIANTSRDRTKCWGRSAAVAEL